MKSVKPLINEFEVIQNTELVSKIEQICNKIFEKDTRNFRISVILFLVSLAGCIFISPFFLGLAVVGTGIAVHGLIKTGDASKDLEAIKKNNFAYNTPIITNEIRDVLINYRKKYHTEYYAKNPTTEVIKSTQEDEDNSFLNKSNTMAVISYEYTTLKAQYDIKDLTVTDIEWQMLFDLTYDLFKSKGIEKNFYDFMSRLLRYAISIQLLENGSNISIYNFLKGFDYIRIEYVTKEELDNIKAVILEETSKNKIVDISGRVKREIK